MLESSSESFVSPQEPNTIWSSLFNDENTIERERQKSLSRHERQREYDTYKASRQQEVLTLQHALDYPDDRLRDYIKANTVYALSDIMDEYQKSRPNVFGYERAHKILVDVLADELLATMEYGDDEYEQSEQSELIIELERQRLMAAKRAEEDARMVRVKDVMLNHFLRGD